jgi:hypothetical protein
VTGPRRKFGAEGHAYTSASEKFQAISHKAPAFSGREKVQPLFNLGEKGKGRFKR